MNQEAREAANRAMYQAFFDELSSIEKLSMEKEAIIGSVSSQSVLVGWQLELPLRATGSIGCAT
jgi:hypothetical protein